MSIGRVGAKNSVDKYHIIFYYGDVNTAINILTESLKQEQYI
ncbi:hypothetical protein GMMP15_140056 [Candidatus Magnetomoraceae bacterium gMMP-15]